MKPLVRAALDAHGRRKGLLYYVCVVHHRVFRVRRVEPANGGISDGLCDRRCVAEYLRTHGGKAA